MPTGSEGAGLASEERIEFAPRDGQSGPTNLSDGTIDTVS